MIVDVEASAVNKTAEVEATKTMIDRVEEKFAIKPRRLVGDTNYGVAAMLGWLVNEKKIAPRVPVWDKSEHHDGTFSRADFIFDAEKPLRLPCQQTPKAGSTQSAEKSVSLSGQPVRLSGFVS